MKKLDELRADLAALDTLAQPSAELRAARQAIATVEVLICSADADHVARLSAIDDARSAEIARHHATRGPLLERLRAHEAEASTEKQALSLEEKAAAGFALALEAKHSKSIAALRRLLLDVG